MKSRTTCFLILTMICLIACTGGKGQSVADTSQMRSFGNNSNSNVLVGAGSNLAYPLLSKLFAEYAKETRVMVNYQSIGTTGGVLQFTKKATDFAATDVRLNEAQIKKTPMPVLQIALFRQLVRANPGDSAKSKFVEVLIYKEQNYDGRSLMRAQKLLKMLWWSVHSGQKYNDGRNYESLPPASVATAENILRSATFDGKPILP